MTRKYFGTDGIRGRANGVITPDLALKVGQAITVQNNPGSPTVKTAINTANVGTVYQEIIAVAIGYPVCAPIFSTCGIDAATFVQAMRR